MINRQDPNNLSAPYPFTEDSDFKEMLLHVIQYTRDEFHRRKTTTMVVSSPTIFYKVSSGEIVVGDKLRACSPKKQKILVTLSVTFLGGQWSTKHKKRNATVDKETMEKNILKIFGEKIPWKPKKKEKSSE
jgi:hypothetical protein